MLYGSEILPFVFKPEIYSAPSSRFFLIHFAPENQRSKGPWVA